MPLIGTRATGSSRGYGQFGKRPLIIVNPVLFGTAVTGSIADTSWNITSFSSSPGNTYGCTGWKGNFYSFVNGYINKLTSATGGYSTIANITSCREAGTIRNSLVYSNIGSPNVSTSTLYYTNLTSGGDGAGNGSFSTPFTWDGIITTSHFNYLGFVYNTTLYLAKMNFDANGYVTGVASYTSHSISGGDPDGSYNGTGGYYDANTGYLYINRWNSGSLSMQEFSGPTIQTVDGSASGSFSFTQYKNCYDGRTSIGAGADPWTGRVMHCFHGDGNICYKNSAMSTYGSWTSSVTDPDAPPPALIQTAVSSFSGAAPAWSSTNFTGRYFDGLPIISYADTEWILFSAGGSNVFSTTPTRQGDTTATESTPTSSAIFTTDWSSAREQTAYSFGGYKDSSTAGWLNIYNSHPYLNPLGNRNMSSTARVILPGETLQHLIVFADFYRSNDGTSTRRSIAGSYAFDGSSTWTTDMVASWRGSAATSTSYGISNDGTNGDMFISASRTAATPYYVYVLECGYTISSFGFVLIKVKPNTTALSFK